MLDSNTRKMKKLVVFLLLWLVVSTVENGASTIQAHLLPAGTARVYGYALYSENIGMNPIRRAGIELWEDAFIDTRLATSETTDDGYYEFTISLTGSKNVYVKIYCESPIALVTDGIFNDPYWERTSTRTISEGSTTYLGVYYAPPDSVYWQAMDYAVDEYLWMKNKVNWTRSQVEIEYPVGNKPTTYGDVIQLPQKSIWEWNRVTILHEYAHCVMYAVYGYLPEGYCSDQCQCPQSDHLFNSAADNGFAFREGWADFMQSAVDSNPSNTYLHDLGDVDGDFIPNGFATTIEDNEYPAKGRTYKWYHGRCYPARHDGNTVEGAAAGIFWDIFDPGNDDRLYMGFGPIWYIIYMYKPRSMVEFWHYWFNVYDYKQEMSDIYLDHGIPTIGKTDWLYYDNTFFVAGNQAYCTDVLGSAKIAFGLGKGNTLQNPEGRTDTILKYAEHTTGDLIIVGGPAINPLAVEFDDIFGIIYIHTPGVGFQIFCEGESTYLRLSDYPHEDICIVYVGENNSRSVLLVWGYGWQGTYAGSAFMGNPVNWQQYKDAHMLMLRWIDWDMDGLVQMNEVYVEKYTPKSTHLNNSFDHLFDTEASTDSFNNLASLFYNYSFFAVGDQAYCTDVLGSAKIAFGLAKGGAFENAEGRTDLIMTPAEHDTGNLMIVGGPAINPLAVEFDSKFDIAYNHNPGVSFQIFCEGKSIYLDLTQYPRQDICIVYLGTHNSRNVLLVWGYGWQGTYAGSAFMGNPVNWQAYSGAHMLMLRWVDSNADDLVQMTEIIVEAYI
ncbi:MAG: hypothetical protein HXS48_07350 [Theionarchaea archaeon]|nr:hypothetical protein [Theionarchaea archaeon]